MFDEVPTSLIGVVLRAGRLGWKRRQIFQCWWRGWRLGDKPIRVSCAQLIRIEFAGKFLLVPSARIARQMQPPGGVVQTRSDGEAFLRRIGAHRGPDWSSEDKDLADLRLYVPGKHLVEFLGWYGGGQGREASPADREFSEELVQTGILDEGLFRQPKLTSYKTVITGPRHTEYFGGCTELLLHQFFNLTDLSGEQTQFLRSRQDDKHCGARVGTRARFGWFTNKDIAAGGWFPDTSTQTWKIADHAKWMI